MTQQKIHINSCGNDWDVARKAVCSAYFHNAAKIKVPARVKELGYSTADEYMNQFQLFIRSYGPIVSGGIQGSSQAVEAMGSTAFTIWDVRVIYIPWGL